MTPMTAPLSQASIQVAGREPSETIPRRTLGTYSHVTAGMQREAAGTVAGLIFPVCQVPGRPLANRS